MTRKCCSGKAPPIHQLSDSAWQGHRNPGFGTRVGCGGRIVEARWRATRHIPACQSFPGVCDYAYGQRPPSLGKANPPRRVYGRLGLRAKYSRCFVCWRCKGPSSATMGCDRAVSPQRISQGTPRSDRAKNPQSGCSDQGRSRRLTPFRYGWELPCARELFGRAHRLSM